MIAFVILFQLQLHKPSCLKFKPFVNSYVLEKLHYDEYDSPSLVFCNALDY